MTTLNPDPDPEALWRALTLGQQAAIADTTGAVTVSAEDWPGLVEGGLVEDRIDWFTLTPLGRRVRAAGLRMEGREEPGAEPMW